MRARLFFLAAFAAATGAAFAREIFAGAFAGDFGLWVRTAGDTFRYRREVGAEACRLIFNINAEFAAPIAPRPLGDVARSIVFSSMPDALCVSGPITSQPADASGLAEVSESIRGSGVPVLVNTGFRAAKTAGRPPLPESIDPDIDPAIQRICHPIISRSFGSGYITRRNVLRCSVAGNTLRQRCRAPAGRRTSTRACVPRSAWDNPSAGKRQVDRSGSTVRPQPVRRSPVRRAWESPGRETRCPGAKSGARSGPKTRRSRLSGRARWRSARTDTAAVRRLVRATPSRSAAGASAISTNCVLST